jgi:hypothetical protein
MTSYEDIARQRLALDRIEDRRRLKKRNRFAEAIGFLLGLLIAVGAAYVFSVFILSLG